MCAAKDRRDVTHWQHWQQIDHHSPARLHFNTKFCIGMPIITVDAALALPRALRRSIIGVDVGSAKTGFAVAASAQHAAQPAGVLRALIDRSELCRADHD